MFAWETVGKKTFKSLPADLFPKTKSLAANQGLYNGFLAAGLGWTFFIENRDWFTKERLCNRVIIPYQNHPNKT